MDHDIKASSLNRRASSSSILDASTKRLGPSYIFITDGEGGGDGVVTAGVATVGDGTVGGGTNTVWGRRDRRNKEPDILPRKLTIDVDVGSTDVGLIGGKVDPLVFSLLRRAVRRGVAAWSSATV